MNLFYMDFISSFTYFDFKHQLENMLKINTVERSFVQLQEFNKYQFHDYNSIMAKAGDS